MSFSNFSNSTRITIVSFSIALVGFVILATLATQLPAPIAFAIAAITTGLIIKLVITTTTENAVVETTTLYVGNLPYRANETSIRTLFSDYGLVLSVRLMKDKHTGKRRGFGFVEMSAADAQKAVDALNDVEYQQRTLKVREANERTAASE